MNAFKNKVVVVTGGAKGIGRCICEEFRREGASVCIIDLLPNEYFQGDVAKKEDLDALAERVIREYGRVDVLVNNALPPMRGLDACSYDEFEYALRVGVTAPFYLSKRFTPYFSKDGSIINISSSRDRMSQPQTESYTAAKGGIAALTHALAVSLAGRVRVNSISPGWIDTTDMGYEGADALQQPVGRVGRPRDIADMVLFLASEKAGFITGENICIDGGMTRQMIYHGDHGWRLQMEAERAGKERKAPPFYGWETASAVPVSPEFKRVTSPQRLFELLSELWCAQTCSPRLRDKWRADNPTLGQCAVTAFLAQEIFGGRVYGIQRPGGNFHCYNVVGDACFDLTSAQYGENGKNLNYEGNPEQLRELHFAREEKRLRYERLRSLLLERLEEP